MISQINIKIKARNRGFHLITDEITDILNELPRTGILNLFIKHTSCGITINENADPSVRVDFENIMNVLIPENQVYYTHILEGSDDMPAHVKSSLFNVSLSIPITDHKMNLGIWQGIYLCEFRNNGGDRNIIATIME